MTARVRKAPTIMFGRRLCGLHAGDAVIAGLPDDDEETVVDLRPVEFADPSGVVSFVTACVEAGDAGNDLAILAPTDRNVSNYLLRIQFRDLLRERQVRFPGSFGTREVFSRPLADHLLELQIVTKRNATMITEKLMSLGGAIGIPDRVLRPAFLGLAEGVENTLEHSGTDNAIVVAQRYRLAPDRLRLEVSIGDVGLGLRATLRRRWEVVDDAEAVELAVRKGISRFAAARHGNGLSNVVDAVTGRGGGSFEIRSGDASLFTRGEPTTRRHPVRRDGVQIAMSVLGRASKGH